MSRQDHYLILAVTLLIASFVAMAVPSAALTLCIASVLVFILAGTTAHRKRH